MSFPLFYLLFIHERFLIATNIIIFILFINYAIFKWNYFFPFYSPFNPHVTSYFHLKKIQNFFNKFCYNIHTKSIIKSEWLGVNIFWYLKINKQSIYTYLTTSDLKIKIKIEFCFLSIYSFDIYFIMYLRRFGLLDTTPQILFCKLVFQFHQ